MIEKIILLLVGIALFIVGMSLMSSNLTKATGKGIKRLFNKIGDNRFAGLGIGAGVTAAVQSSGTTSVMTIGFINAGVMTAFQGLCIILGAYIGTTVTGILVSFSSFNFSQYLVLTLVIGAILSFFKNEKIKNIAGILIGFGVLFFGLETMKGTFTGEGGLSESFQNILVNINNPILLLLIGALITAIVQSSSATSGIVIIMVGGGALDMTSGFYLVLGATIGTVIVAILASIGGSTNSKRVAVVCLIVRIFTAICATALVWISELINEGTIENVLLTMFNGNNEIALAMFLLFYSLISVSILLPFIRPLTKLGEKLVKDKSEEAKKNVLHFIDKKMLVNTSIALGQAKNEIVHMLDLSRDNLERGFVAITTQDLSKEALVAEKEDHIDIINNELTNFLIQLSHGATPSEEQIIGTYFHIINDIERIGDHAYNFFDNAVKMVDNDLKFSQVAIDELNEMYSYVFKMFALAKEIFITGNYDKLIEIHQLEDSTDKQKLTLSESHFKRITQNLCFAELSPYFTTVVSELERIADHLVNIGYSLLNPTGDDEGVDLQKSQN